MCIVSTTLPTVGYSVDNFTGAVKRNQNNDSVGYITDRPSASVQ